MRKYKVIDKNSIFYNQIGELVAEAKNYVFLRFGKDGDYLNKLFDKKEVEELD